MNLKIKKTISLAVVFSMLLLLIACGAEPSPYETNNNENYTVSVKYDANGGIFTTNTSVIVDSYNINDLPKGSNGNAEIALLAPDDSARGIDAFKAVNNGYFLAGWYTERKEASDASGNTAYSYSGRWDFEKSVLSVDIGKEYSSDSPVLTLYAAWIPLFEVEFYKVGSDELIAEYTLNPLEENELQIPAWSQESGTIDMFKFPTLSGYTFYKASLDKDGALALTDNTVSHTGKINYENGSAENPVMKIYVDYIEGEWYKIYTADMLIDNARLDGCYEICSDLDFEGKIWPTVFMHGNFSGKIVGSDFAIKNIQATQTNNSKVNGGLFGNITETAEISNLTIENATFTVQAGTRVADTCYGLLAGTLSADAKIISLAIKSSKLEIDSSCYFGTDSYSIGLVCGKGDAGVIENPEIECVAVGAEPERVIIGVDGNTVTVEFAE